MKYKIRDCKYKIYDKKYKDKWGNYLRYCSKFKIKCPYFAQSKINVCKNAKI
jgi:hypothetical protein